MLTELPGPQAPPVGTLIFLFVISGTRHVVNEILDVLVCFTNCRASSEMSVVIVWNSLEKFRKTSNFVNQVLTVVKLFSVDRRGDKPGEDRRRQRKEN